MALDKARIQVRAALTELQHVTPNVALARAALLTAVKEIDLVTPVPTPTPTPTPGTGTRVKVGDNLQAAIDAAKPGDTLLVQPGTYPGVTLRTKSGTAPITIQPDTANLKAGQRLTPDALPDLIKLTSPDGSYVVKADKGGTNYVLRGFAPQPFGDGGTAFAYIGDENETVPANLAHDITIDQWVVIADPKGGKRGIGLNARNLAVRNSHIAGFYHSDDAQAIGGWNGSASILIENNYLEASGENILFGGADSKNALMIPQSLVVRGNVMTKPLAWRSIKTGITTKNTFELKTMLHALIENNVIENAWADGQVGALVLFTTRDQSATAPWSQIADITFQNNVVRHGAAFVQILGLDDVTRPSVRLSGLRIINNLVYDIDPAKWNNPKDGAWGSGRMLQITAGPDNVEIAHNSMFGSDPNVNANINSAVSIGGQGDKYKTERLNIHDNVMPEGDYGIAGDNAAPGRPALDAYAPGAIFTNNVIVRGSSGRNINYGPQPNVVTDAGSKPINPATFTAVASYPTTDGKPVGCDVAALRALIPGLDLTK